MSTRWIKPSTAYTDYTVLLSSATGAPLATPTLATGDEQTSLDGVTFNNLTALPTVTPAASCQVQYVLSAAEVGTNTVIMLRFKDQTSPAEWDTQFIEHRTDRIGLAWDVPLADHDIEDSVGNVLNDMVAEDGGGVYQYTANALENGSADLTPVTDILSNATYGNSALHADIAAIPTTTAPSAASVADAVWNAATASYTATGSFGLFFSGLISAIWNWTGLGGRTLTTAAASLAASSAGALSKKRGDVLNHTFTGLPSSAGYTHIDFTVKNSTSDDDSAAIIHLRVSATPEATDGLITLNGAPSGDLNAGSITVVSATSITIHVDGDKTAQITPNSGRVYDVQYFLTDVTDGPVTAEEGTFAVTADVTRAVA